MNRPTRTAAHRPSSRHGVCLRKQRGQSLIEAMVVLLGLLSIWVAVAWLARLQEIGMAAQNAASRVAFAAARFDSRSPENYVKSEFFSGPAHQWSDRRGKHIMTGDDQLYADHLRRAALAPAGQPGGESPISRALRTDWRIDDVGVLDAWVIAAPGSSFVRQPSTSTTGLEQFEDIYPVLRRHTAILTDAGHASNDIHVQNTLQRSEQAWRQSADVSTSLAEQVGAIMEPVDSAWDRPSLQLDWLSPWAGQVPRNHRLHLNEVPDEH